MKQIKDLKREEIKLVSDRIFEIIKFAGNELNLSPIAISELLIKAAETLTELMLVEAIENSLKDVKMKVAQKDGTKFPRA